MPPIPKAISDQEPPQSPTLPTAPSQIPVSPPEQPERSETIDSTPEEPDPTPPPKSNDPYANLDAAFGGYIADQPRPMQGGRQSEFDDLLM